MGQLFRITARRYRPIDTTGAMTQPGRWHALGHPVLYFSSSLALAVLELRVNGVSFSALRELYHYTAVDSEIDRRNLETIPESFYGADWMVHHERTRDFGAKWSSENRSLFLEVRSAALQAESNYLVNSRHVGFAKLSFADPKPIPVGTPFLAHSSTPCRIKEGTQPGEAAVLSGSRMFNDGNDLS